MKRIPIHPEGPEPRRPDQIRPLSIVLHKNGNALGFHTGLTVVSFRSGLIILAAWMLPCPLQPTLTRKKVKGRAHRPHTLVVVVYYFCLESSFLPSEASRMGRIVILITSNRK